MWLLVILSSGWQMKKNLICKLLWNSASQKNKKNINDKKKYSRPRLPLENKHAISRFLLQKLLRVTRARRQGWDSNDPKSLITASNERCVQWGRHDDLWVCGLICNEHHIVITRPMSSSLHQWNISQPFKKQLTPGRFFMHRMTRRCFFFFFFFFLWCVFSSHPSHCKCHLQ